MKPNTLHTTYGPYRTAQPVKAVEFVDVIYPESTGRTLYAVHPVPKAWLGNSLSEDEYQDMLAHIATLLSDCGQAPSIRTGCTADACTP
jgi:hypothetical protein